MSFEEMQAILQGILLSHQQFQADVGEIKAITERNSQIVESNSRAIQAMLDQAATDRLRDEERRQQHEERMQRLEAMSMGLINLSAAIDEDRPTILRLLNSNNNKLDAILDRLPPQQ
jgi:DNA repair exonuclease SbcCD ATPase subunit